MYLVSIALVAFYAWQKRATIGRVLAAMAEPFRARGVRIDAEMLGVRIPEAKEDWSVYDAPAFARLAGRKTAI